MSSAKASLLETESVVRTSFSPAPFRDFAPHEVTDDADVKAVVGRLVQQFLSIKGMGGSLNSTLLYLFAAHMLLLPTLAVSERARKERKLHKDLRNHLQSSFLPTALFSLELASGSADVDVDGSIFLDILNLFLDQPSSSFQAIFGATIHSILQDIWLRCGTPTIDILSLSRRFPHMAPPHHHNEAVVIEDISVLPFSNSLFDETAFTLQGVSTEPSAEIALQGANTSHPRFVDNHHWHNHRQTILPKHLGGDEPVAVSDWERKRRLRSEQRFVAKMQWQAESLTGALGKPLERLTIICDKSSRNKATKPKDRQVCPEQTSLMSFLPLTGTSRLPSSRTKARRSMFPRLIRSVRSMRYRRGQKRIPPTPFGGRKG